MTYQNYMQKQAKSSCPKNIFYHILYYYPIQCMCLIEYQTYLHIIKIKSRNKRNVGRLNKNNYFVVAYIVQLSNVYALNISTLFSYYLQQETLSIMELTNTKLSSTINDNIIRIEASYFADDIIYALDIINQIFRSRKQHVTLY